MSKPLFRKVSLDRLSSPEQLDTMMRISSPWGWLSLSAIALMLLTAIWWGISGEIVTQVNGKGILMNSGGIHNVLTDSEGQILDLRVVRDDIVRQGETIARVSHPEILNQIAQSKAELASITAETDGSDKKTKIAVLQQTIVDLQAEYDRISRVVSPYNGRVIEVKASRGDFVTQGTPIVSLELTSGDFKDLIAIMYISADDAKSIIPGKEVKISPGNVKKEEYGYLLGKVTSVGKYPISSQSMMQFLGNEMLVETLSNRGASVEVRIDIIPDERTISQYKWSTRKGPPIAMNSGTMFDGSITIGKERPIHKMLPNIN